MILDKLENAFLYQHLNEKINKAFEYLNSTDFSLLPEAVYDISDGIFAIVSEYNSKNEADCKLEAHRKYIDIQYLVAGEELIGYASLNKQKNITEYNDDKDVIFFEGEVSYSKISQGMFAIYFPTDIHQPCVKIEKSLPIKKVVVKVPSTKLA
ncbi:MAG: YhcH/YjgK/YiaL family protein [Salinivirgaceae bacterium]|nr:YhcH/YjgK/YiaL family protein [Salinivirgaceae bacterium]